MSSNVKWISKVFSTMFVMLGFISAGFAQVQVFIQPRSWAPADEARDIFNAGLRSYDASRFSDAELKFRDVVQRFPKNVITDRADYYLIRTMVQSGKTNEALRRIDAFPKQYPKSTWLKDVEELRIQLTNQLPPKAEDMLLRPIQFAPAAVRPVLQVAPGPFAPPAPPAPPAPSPFGFAIQSSDPEISLQQEVMGAIFRNNFDRALEIAAERLKANPVDPVVLSSLHLVAASRSAPAVSMLVGIVKDSPNPKARRDAIFWLGQSKGDKDAIVDTLVGLLPSMADDDSEAAAYTLSQMRTDKALNALASMARDKSKSEKVRNNSVFWIGQSRVSNRVTLLDGIYKNAMDNAKVRQQVLFALSQTRDPQAVPVLGNAASSDPDIEVRKQAVFWLEQNRSPEATQVLERLLKK
jgi:hypothetical protein